MSQIEPKQCDPRDAEAFARHTPRSSPDTALTAFCQLAALRFNVKRSMLFFFDTVSSYVLAEATQSLSLQCDARHAFEDNLWLGYAVVPRGNSVCEHTVKMPLSPAEDSEIGSQIPINVIPDLQGDATFCGLPLVTAGPKCRFYAGAPIVTSKGVNIGAFCVMDDAPRDGITEQDATFLRDMSATVTTHLEIVRSKREQQRGMQMITGLGAFVQGCSDLRDWHHNVDNRKEKHKSGGSLGVLRASRSSTALGHRNEPASDHLPPVPAFPSLHSGRSADHSDSTTSSLSTHLQPARSNDGLSRTSSAPVASPGAGSDGSRPSLSPQHSASQVSVGSPVRHGDAARDAAENAPAESVSSDVRSTYQRAAELLREATEAHGTAFLDASIGAFGGLVESMRGQDDSEEASTSAHETDSAGTEGKSTTSNEQHEPSAPKLCRVLGSAVDSAWGHANDRPQIAVTERFLKSLLRRYPHGMIWNFDENGQASSEDESSSGNTSDKFSGPSSRPNASSQIPKNSTVRDKKKRRRTRQEDARLIQQHFPGMRSIGLHGLWDQAKGRWYAACIIWTYSPLRIFSVTSEMNFVAAFCDVIMAETRRLEIQRIDNAKSSVLASVSHELRSPLHGILGSAEVLQDQPIDDLSTSLVSQIESCGRTLLDIIDHLLDFSDINHFVSRQNKRSTGQKPNERQRVSGGSMQRSQMGGMMSLDVDVALDQVTEEVTEAAVYSYYCSKPVGANDHVTTILDIDRPTNCNWRCRIAAGGWRRIIMNLVTNALKYTDKGQVYIGLKSEAVKGSRKRENAVLTVADSGQGMSKGFLEEGLYQAFSQENTLVEGMGLGMSMVQRIVQAFHGTIDVNSDQIGGGTRVTVTIPIEKTQVAKQPNDPEEDEKRDRLRGVQAGIYNTKITPARSAGHVAMRPTLLASVTKALQQDGLGVAQVSSLDDVTKQLVVVTEGDLALLDREHQQHDSNRSNSSQSITTPVIVICDSVQSERILRRQVPSILANTPVDFVSQPCGPARLQEAVLACLQRKNTATGVQRSEGLPFQDALASSDAKQLEEQPKTPPGSGHEKPASPASSVAPPKTQEREEDAKPSTDSPTAEQPIDSATKQPNRLPIRELAAAANHKRETADSGITLLLVDDNHINLSLLQTYAKKNSHTALTATDGAQAVSAYKTAHKAVPPAIPQVVVMDINMPVLNGFEATQQIRAYEQAHGLQAATIIALTGLGSADAQREAFSSGLDLFLTKPVRLKELGRVISGLKDKGNGD